MTRPRWRSCGTQSGMRVVHNTTIGRAVRRAAGALAFVLALFACAGALLAQEGSEPVPEWLRQARVAGAQLFSDMSAHEIEATVSALSAQHVSVIEADSDLSRWLTDGEFERELALMRRYSDAAHGSGMRVVWYTPTLEVLSAHARGGRRSMYQLHPD